MERFVELTARDAHYELQAASDESRLERECREVLSVLQSEPRFRVQVLYKANWQESDGRHFCTMRFYGEGDLLDLLQREFARLGFEVVLNGNETPE
ncbi:MAG: hypothetical protein GF346_09105 [Candidatus Eisenbacteria bacterium]|nr:hypothetical protein [Candidatus Eisenbacteria bacterium]